MLAGRQRLSSAVRRGASSLSVRRPLHGVAVDAFVLPTRRPTLFIPGIRATACRSLGQGQSFSAKNPTQIATLREPWAWPRREWEPLRYRRQCTKCGRGADRQQPHRPEKRERRFGSIEVPHFPGRRRASHPGHLRPHPARPRQVGSSPRRPHRHHLARRHRLDQPRRLGQPARPVPPAGNGRRLCQSKDCVRTKMGGHKQGPAHRARHRREQPFSHARRIGARRRPVRHAPLSRRHALRPVHRPRPRCLELRLLPGCALHPRRDAERHHPRSRRRAHKSINPRDRARPARRAINLRSPTSSRRCSKRAFRLVDDADGEADIYAFPPGRSPSRTQRRNCATAARRR